MQIKGLLKNYPELVSMLGPQTFVATDWAHFLTRPFSLFGASLWQSWYDSEQIQELLGVATPDALFLEEHHHVVRYYKKRHQLEHLRTAVKEVIRSNPTQLATFYQRGFVLNARAEAFLTKGPSSFINLDEAVKFIIDLALHATVIPNMSLGFFDDLKVTDNKLREAAEKLRSVSYYPRFVREVIMPHVSEVLKKNAIEDLAAADLITLTELRNRHFNGIEARLTARKESKNFIYQLLRGTETIQWTVDIQSLVYKIEGIEGVSREKIREIKGQVAYKGVARGVARLVLSDHGTNTTFNEGDILVSINSNPTLMPFIRKAAAIVTDEGGIASHAAIVSRELKKPCVIGTKISTKVLKDGDMVEVDANHGVVRKL